MRNIRILFACFALLFCGNAFSQSPSELIDEMIAQLDKHTIASRFVVALQADWISDPEIYRGEIRMKGRSFHLNMSGLEVYYDGTTQWAYQEAANEVTISTPTSDDLAGINPLAMVKQFKRTCRIEFYDKEKKDDSHIIVFYPKEEKSDINKLIVTINKKDKLPTKIVLEASQGNVTTLVLSGLQLLSNSSNADFVGTDKFPQAIINDLR